MSLRKDILRRVCPTELKSFGFIALSMFKKYADVFVSHFTGHHFMCFLTLKQKATCLLKKKVKKQQHSIGSVLSNVIFFATKPRYLQTGGRFNQLVLGYNAVPGYKNIFFFFFFHNLLSLSFNTLPWFIIKS